MKSWFHSASIACGLLVFAGVQDASAQITDSLSFKTSFPFVVDNTTLPAGTYTVTPNDDDPSVLDLRGPHNSMIVVTRSAQAAPAPSKTEVVFNRYNDRYVMKNIWVAGSETGYLTDYSVGERHAAKHGETPQEHRVAASHTKKTSGKTAPPTGSSNKSKAS